MGGVASNPNTHRTLNLVSLYRSIINHS
jgi:hypothetical protein